MESDRLQYWVGFNLIPGVGPAKLRRLLDRFGDLEEAWFASGPALLEAGLDQRTVDMVLDARRRVRPVQELEKVLRLGVQVLTLGDESYPARLKEIYDAPPVLYVRGQLKAEDEWCVSIVGTRRATPYGREVAERLAADLARQKVTVVSGLARGIDSAAHRSAVQAGGRTIAVLGSGVDVIYPAENGKLAETLMRQGALVSEYPLGTKPDAGNFPPRNRIISGLSLGVVVVEAGEASGANWTVRFALEQNREVFAVPGSIFAPMSRGANKLIQEGAKLVTSYQDVLSELNLQMVGQQMEMKELLPADEVEAALLKHLSGEPTHIDEVRRATGLPIARVSATLTMMELKGMVRQVGGTSYVLAR